MSRVDSSVHLIYHDLSDLRSLILIPIIPKELTLGVLLPFDKGCPPYIESKKMREEQEGQSLGDCQENSVRALFLTLPQFGISMH